MKLFLLFLSSFILVQCAPVEEIEWNAIHDLLKNRTILKEIQPRSVYLLEEGKRQDGDALLQTDSDDYTFILTPMPITLLSKYPKPGLIPKTITYIKGTVSFMSGSGSIKVTAGGVGLKTALVTMNSPKCSGYFYSVSYYGK